jgi:hypothetical protein
MDDHASADSPFARSNDQLTRDQLLTVYTELCSNIRATDETSFKLLSAVPFASGVGAGVLTILDKSNLLNSVYAVMGLSLLGAVITLGLFRWELRNIQKCNWLIACAAKVEQRLRLPQGEDNLQYLGMTDAQHLSATALKDVRNSRIFISLKKSSESQKPKEQWNISKSWAISTSWGKTQAEKLIYTAAFIAWLIPMAFALVNMLDTGNK